MQPLRETFRGDAGTSKAHRALARNFRSHARGPGTPAEPPEASAGCSQKHRACCQSRGASRALTGSRGQASPAAAGAGAERGARTGSGTGTGTREPPPRPFPWRPPAPRRGAQEEQPHAGLAQVAPPAWSSKPSAGSRRPAPTWPDRERGARRRRTRSPAASSPPAGPAGGAEGARAREGASGRNGAGDRRPVC